MERCIPVGTTRTLVEAFGVINRSIVFFSRLYIQNIKLYTVVSDQQVSSQSRVSELRHTVFTAPSFGQFFLETRHGDK